MRMLEKVPLFAGLPTSSLTTIGNCASARTFAARTVIVREGEKSDALYVVLYGRLKVCVNGTGGDEVILNIVRTGECFGEMAMMDNSPRSASVVAMESSRLLIISKNAFKDCLKSDPETAFNLIRALNQRVRMLTGEVKNLALLDVNGRVARALLRLAEPCAEGLVVEPKITHQQIAQMVGASREMVTRVLRELKKRGHIATKGRRITISAKMPIDW